MVSKLARIWVKENSMPLGTEKNTLLGAAGGGDVNYFGDGSDGALDTTGNVTHTVPSKNGSYDGDMVVKQYTSLDINSGHTMTVDQPCRGMLIYVTGDCIIAGTLSMTARGAYASATSSGGSDSSAVNASGIQLGMFTASGSDTLAAATFDGCGTPAVTAVANQAAISSNGTLFSIERAGSAAGTGASCPSGCSTAGDPGDNGSSDASLQTAGGGAGGAKQNAHSGNGGSSTCFSGGSGGGGGYGCGGSGGGSGGSGNGGPGGSTNCGPNIGGGAGNPGSQSGEDGTGGLIWLVVGGDLTITGSIVAKGKNGGSGHYYSGGGGSGGGAIMILYAGTLSNSGTVSASGGSGGSASRSQGAYGGRGGHGGTNLTQVSAA